MIVSGMVDFKKHLRQQLSFLENSNEFYDKGKFEEAVRIAVALRVIFHNTNLSTSLLNHLKANPLMLSTAAPFADKHPEIPDLYLVELVATIPEGVCCAEPLSAVKHHSTHSSDVETWWSKEVVIDLKDGQNTISRRDLVLAAANKDGGAHVDLALEPRYQKAMEGAGISVEITFKDGRTPTGEPFRNIHFASLRQISYEVLNSPELIALA